MATNSLNKGGGRQPAPGVENAVRALTRAHPGSDAVADVLIAVGNLYKACVRQTDDTVNDNAISKLVATLEQKKGSPLMVDERLILEIGYIQAIADFGQALKDVIED